MDTFKITASDSYLIRLPEFLAVELGYFRDVDLDVSSHVPSPWNKVLAELDSGDCQAACDGVWLPSLYRDRVKNYSLFAKLASRFPMTLVSRQPLPNFTWKDVEGKIVLVPGSNEAGTRMYFTGCLREGGADFSKVKYVPNFYVPMLYECFAGGWGDMVLMRTDLANRLVADGKGFVAVDMAAKSGSVPWLAYYAAKETLDRPGDLAGRFTLGLQKALSWLSEHKADDCRDVIAKYWPDLSPADAAGLVDHYLKAGMWDGTAAIGEDELARWEGFMAAAHLIDKPFAHGELVDGRPFAYAANKLGL